MSDSAGYRNIVAHYEACFERHGDSHLGVDWPKLEDVDTRYRVMLDIIGKDSVASPAKLLDFGCGASHLYEYILRRGYDHIKYSGLDLSPRFIELSRKKFPGNQYWCLDVLADGVGGLPRFDYVVMNGVFTEKLSMKFSEMFDFFTAVIERVFALTDIALAFNVMSTHVDWERDDLFHLPLDLLGEWLTDRVSRHFVVRHDYRLYEYTVYIYR